MKKIKKYGSLKWADCMAECCDGEYVLYKDHIAAMNTCVKCGANVTNWDEHIMTCKKSPAVMRIKELESELERCQQDLHEEISNRQ